MVDGLLLRSMATSTTNGAAPAHRRKLRALVSIAQHLETLRTATAIDPIRDALAEVAMRLLAPEDRDEFEGCDGPTVIVDHLNRMAEEQATLDYAWQSSSLYQTKWEGYELHESLVFTVVIISHAAIEDAIALLLMELGAMRLLWELYASLPVDLHTELRPLLLSAMRNLSYVDTAPDATPYELISETWHLLLDSTDAELQVFAAEILTNVSALDVARVGPTRERLLSLVALFFTLEERDCYRRVSVCDLLTNLTVDATLCLLVMYELDDRKPRRYRHHSGAVFFLELTESQRDPGLRQSMEALAHNLSWSDPTGKRKIQKIGLSSFMNRFALEPAINN